jgi:hypothetical protein
MSQWPGMERRLSERIPTSLGVHIYAYGVLVARGITLDMSEHGLLMRIQQDYSDDQLDPGKHLDVMLEYVGLTPEEHWLQQWLPIRVVRKFAEGIAASFIGAEPHSKRDFRRSGFCSA